MFPRKKGYSGPRRIHARRSNAAPLYPYVPEAGKICGSGAEAGSFRPREENDLPHRLFIAENGYAKLQIALARGKKEYDKRNTIKERDVRREMDRGDY